VENNILGEFNIAIKIALRFLVDDNKVAQALHDASYKIIQRDDQKVS